MKKLLYIINHIDWFWSHRLDLTKAAQDKGYEVHVACIGAVGDPRFDDHGFIPHDLPPTKGGIDPIGAIKTVRSISGLLRQIRPDVTHGITIKHGLFTGLAACITPWVTRPKLIFTIAGLGYLFSGEGLKVKALRAAIMPLLRLAFRRKNVSLIFQNPDDAQLMLKRGVATSSHSHIILGSGVNLDKFTAQPLPHIGKRADNKAGKQANKEAAPVIMLPTRLVVEKGVAVFIEAAKIVAQHGIQASFILAGGIDHINPSAYTQSELSQLLAGSPVSWPGKIDNMPAALAECDMVVFPSYYREGVPKALLEAAASGRPIITTDHPGCREVVHHNQNGILTPVKDAPATAQAIIDLLQHPDRMIAMGQASRQMAEDLFDVDKINQKTIALYD